MKQSYQFIFLLLLGLSCSKTTPFTVDVSQITSTDANGNIIGVADNSDWTQDATWSETERSLFLTDPVDMSDAKVAIINLAPAFPNPCANRLISLQFTTSEITFVRIAITDEKLKKLAFYSFKTVAGINAYNIPFPENIFAVNKNYRVYYSFDTFASPMYYKGHGDVSLK